LSADCFAQLRASGWKHLDATYDQVVADLVHTHEIVPRDRRQDLKEWLCDVICGYYDLKASARGDSALTDKQALDIKAEIKQLCTNVRDKLISLYGLEPILDRSWDELETAISTTGGNTTLTESQQRATAIEVSGKLVSNAVIIFSHCGSWDVENNTSGSFSVSCRVRACVKAGADPFWEVPAPADLVGIEIEQGAKRRIYCDGADIFLGDPSDGIARRVMQDTARLHYKLTYHPTLHTRRAYPFAVRDIDKVMEIALRAQLLPQGRCVTREENASNLPLRWLSRQVYEFWIKQVQQPPEVSETSAYFKFAKYITRLLASCVRLGR
jgi:hypothetical protein